MSYSVRVFKNTGFNAVNIPDTPALLNSFSYVDLSSIEVLQDGLLRYVRLRANWSDINTADYVKVGDWYYSVLSIEMTSADVVQLNLLPDFILTAGGAAGLSFVDGIVERACVPLAEDTFGAFTEPDTMTAPSRPLNLVSAFIVPDSASEYQFVETTVDLIPTSGSTDSLCKRFSDTATGAEVDVPYLPPAYPPTTYHIAIGKDVQRGTRLFNASNSVVQERISLARALGMESGIIRQYSIPSGYFTGQPSEDAYHSYQNINASGEFTLVTNIDYEYASPKNKRVLYGEYTPYGLLTVAGNRAEYKAEDILPEGVTPSVSYPCPSVKMVADLQPDGKPYWRYESYLGNDDFWFNAVAGEDWQQLPLVYTDRSGNYLNRQIFDSSRNMARESYELGFIGNAMNTTARILGSGDIVSPETTRLEAQYTQGQNGLYQFSGYAPQTSPASLNMNALFQMAGSAIGGVWNGYATTQMFMAQGELEALRYANANKPVAPEIGIAFNPKIIRDSKGNGVWAYRYEYDGVDIARIDRLLTMYGYRITKAISNDIFSNRPKFNYVKASGVTVTGLPKWWADGIAGQLAAGTRIWHKSPSPADYSTGNE